MLIRRRKNVIPQIAILVFVVWVLYMLYSPGLEEEDKDTREDFEKVQDRFVGEVHQQQEENKVNVLDINHNDINKAPQTPAPGQNNVLHNDHLERIPPQEKHRRVTDSHIKPVQDDVKAEHPVESEEPAEPQMQIELPGNKDKPGIVQL